MTSVWQMGKDGEANKKTKVQQNLLQSPGRGALFETLTVNRLCQRQMVGEMVGEVVGFEMVGEIVGDLLGDAVEGDNVGDVVGAEAVGLVVGD